MPQNRASIGAPSGFNVAVDQELSGSDAPLIVIFLKIFGQFARFEIEIGGGVFQLDESPFRFVGPFP